MHQSRGYSRFIGAAVSAILLSVLACNTSFGSQPDTPATVQSVYATITAHAEEAGLSTTAIATEEPAATGDTTVDDLDVLTATAQAARTGNGTNLTFPRCSDDITVDGSSQDWEALEGVPRFAINQATYGAANWEGPDDLSAYAWACWTDEILYLIVTVTDDVHVQTENGATAWKGDEIELLFDRDLSGDFLEAEWNDDDIQIGLSPGDFEDNPPAAVRYFPTVRDLDAVGIAASPSDDGYLLEAAIGWDDFDITPRSGKNYGFCLALSDNDQAGTANQESMVSHCTNLKVSNPTTWATLQLTD
ncbi:MAG: hypothetical protein JXJ17_17700 [Anaerolineae bacterium]|nr:hypothetical protein [Anaerolineae bacterium]